MPESVTLDAANFSIKTEVFEGPLELLLELVEKRKLLINDISLAAVTDEYLSVVAAMEEKSLPHTTSFVQLAATLLLIKSKSLLPVLELTEEEESTIEHLEDRLKLYQVYRDAGKLVEQSFGKRFMYERRYVPSTEPMFILDDYCSLPILSELMLGIVSNLPLEVKKPRVQIRPVISLEEMIDRLHKRIEEATKITFRELIMGETEHKNVIVGFLAVLESVKQGSIIVAQLERFADIEIERDGTSLPRYY